MFILHCLHVQKSHEIDWNPVTNHTAIKPWARPSGKNLVATFWTTLFYNVFQHVSTKWHDHIWSHDTHGGNAHTWLGSPIGLGEFLGLEGSGGWAPYFLDPILDWTGNRKTFEKTCENSIIIYCKKIDVGCLPWFAYYVCMILNDLAIFYHQVRRTGFSEGFLQGLRPSRCSSQVRKDQRWRHSHESKEGGWWIARLHGDRKCPLEVPAGSAGFVSAISTSLHWATLCRETAAMREARTE